MHNVYATYTKKLISKIKHYGGMRILGNKLKLEEECGRNVW